MQQIQPKKLKFMRPRQLTLEEAANYAKYGRIEDCLFSQCPVEDINYLESLPQPHFYVISHNNWFLRINCRTHAIVNKLHMGLSHTFKFISWDTQEERLYLSSSSTENGTKVITLALFSVWPLRFEGAFSISSESFGYDIKETLLSETLLLITSVNGVVRLYGFDYDFQTLPLDNLNFVQKFPMIPSFENCCRLLFQVAAPWDFFTVGGTPWHYIIFSSWTQSQYGVHDLRTKQIAKDGTIDLNTPLIEPDKCFFYPDGSGKIVKVGNDSVTVYRLKNEGFDKLNNNTPSYALETLYKLDYSAEKTHEITHTSSGRVIKRRKFPGTISGNIFPKVQAVVCESDLDIMGVVTLSDYVRDSTHKAILSFYDSETGSFISKIELCATWDMCLEHDVKFELDTIYHCMKTGSTHILVTHRLLMT